MPNFEQSGQKLHDEGVAPSSEEVREALQAHQEVLDKITHEAEEMLSASAGQYEDAIEAANQEGRVDLAEKLRVMYNNSQAER